MDDKKKGGLLWSSELASLERTLAAVQFQKEYLFLLSRLPSLSAEEQKGNSCTLVELIRE